MKIFKQLCRTLVLSAVAVALSVGLMGCPPNDVPDDNPVTPNNMGSFSYNGQTYKTVKIGSQTWMAENMNYVTEDSWCLEMDEYNCTNKGKGRLYTWEMAMSVCPSEWHLPSPGEWNVLTDFVGGGAWAVAQKLMTPTDWGNYVGTDEFGFAAVPTGYRDGDNRKFYHSDYAYWWTSSEDGAKAYYQVLQSDGYGMGRFNNPKRYGYAVRCLKD
jgi:uncharacterized protein (TIGR02145 family)